MTGFIAVSFGPWSGIWAYSGWNWCLVLGWMTVVYIPADLDQLMQESSEIIVQSDRWRGLQK